MVASRDLLLKANPFGMDPVMGRTPHSHFDFDHRFFGMHSKLVYWADPCARLGYEVAFESIVDAGINPSALRGSSTNMYAGMAVSQDESLTINRIEYGNGYGVMGLSRAMFPNRISYYFDLHGHSCAFDSSWDWGQQGLQFAHRAIQNGECVAALVLSSNLVAFPQINLHYKNLGLLSDDGLTRSFDAKGPEYCCQSVP